MTKAINEREIVLEVLLDVNIFFISSENCLISSPRASVQI